MDVGNAFELLEELGLMEQARQECKRKKLCEAPYDMIGHNAVYAEFLNKRWVEVRNMKLMVEKAKCCNANAITEEKPAHDECGFCRLSFKKKGYCDSCQLGEKLDALEENMKKCSDGAKAFKDAAEKDFYLR